MDNDLRVANIVKIYTDSDMKNMFSKQELMQIRMFLKFYVKGCLDVTEENEEYVTPSR